VTVSPVSVARLVEPREILRDAAVRAMRESGGDLRKRGWAVELIVDYVPERQTFAVSLRYELPSMPIPQEAS
jgi:hypothetical protein